MIYINIHPAYKEKVEINWVSEAVNASLKHFNIQEIQCETSISIVGNQRIRNLNLQFRGINKPTDVLSFPANEVDPVTGIRMLGDIIISFPQALNQATKEGHSIKDEVMLLVVHGVLHLLDFDHLVPEEKSQMWDHQRNILSFLQIEYINPA